MASPTLSDWNIIIGGIIGTIIASVGTVYGIWERHTTNKREQKLKERELALTEREQKIKEIEKEREWISPLIVDSGISKYRHRLYGAYHDFNKTQSTAEFETEEYKRAVHEVAEAMLNLGYRLGKNHLSVDSFTSTDWIIIRHCGRAIEPYNQYYKKKNGYDYLSEEARFLVNKAEEYWNQKDPSTSAEPPT